MTAAQCNTPTPTPRNTPPAAPLGPGGVIDDLTRKLAADLATSLEGAMASQERTNEFLPSHDVALNLYASIREHLPDHHLSNVERALDAAAKGAAELLEAGAGAGDYGEVQRYAKTVNGFARVLDDVIERTGRQVCRRRRRSALNESLHRLEDVSKLADGGLPLYSPGLADLIPGGVMRGEYIVLAGRPGTAKSTLLAIETARQLREGGSVVYLCNDMSPTILYTRIVAASKRCRGPSQSAKANWPLRRLTTRSPHSS